jgi:hypothetical protein
MKLRSDGKPAFESRSIAATRLIDTVHRRA